MHSRAWSTRWLGRFCLSRSHGRSGWPRSAPRWRFPWAMSCGHALAAHALDPSGLASHKPRLFWSRRGAMITPVLPTYARTDIAFVRGEGASLYAEEIGRAHVLTPVT